MSEHVISDYEGFPQRRLAKSACGTSPKREQVQELDPALSAYIQSLDNEVCGKIVGGVWRPLSRHSISNGIRPLHATPGLLRSSCSKKPLPEARSWCFFFLRHAPEFRLSIPKIATIYNRDNSTIQYGLREVIFAAQKNKPVYYKLDWIARELEEKGYAPPPIAQLIGIVPRER